MASSAVISGPSNTAYAGPIDLETFLDMYERLRERVLYFTVDNLIDRPISFTKNEFDFDSDEYPFGIKRLLKSAKSHKEYVVVGTEKDSSPQGEKVGNIPQGDSIMKEIEQVQINIAGDPFKAALQRLNDCLQEENLQAIQRIQHKHKMEKEKLSEEDILVGVGNHIISKLSGRAITTRKKSQHKCPCGCAMKLDFGEKMYIGSQDTWHGELDMFGLGDHNQECVVVTTAKDVGGGDVTEESSGDSQGERTNLEFKKSIEIPCKEQVISQTIVFAWTEYNRHKDLSPFIPSVLIDSEKFLFFIYSPVHDILLSCEDYIQLFNEKYPRDLSKDRFAGFFVLWVILNHRLFLRKQMIGIDSPVKCGFKEKILNLAPYEKLDDFQILVQRRVKNFNNWCTGNRDVLKRKYSDLD